MGATAIYTLPWPELPDVADGPAAFQALAQATEDAIKSVACTLVSTYTKTTTGNNDNVTSAPKEFDMGPVNLPAAAHTVLIWTSLSLDFSQGGVFAQWIKWDGTELYRPVYNSYSDGTTHDRTYTMMAAVKNQAAGNHTASIGMVSDPGAASMWIKHLMYSAIALGG